MIEIKLYKSRWKAIRLILLSLPFVIGGIFLLMKNDADKTMDWFCICFFGLGIPIGIFNLLDRRPEVILNDQGIFDRASNRMFNKAIDKGFVKWASIKDVYIKIYQQYSHGLPTLKQKFICLELDQDARLHLGTSGKASKFSHILGFGDHNITLTNLEKVDENQLVELIKAMAKGSISSKQALLLSTNLLGSNKRALPVNR